MKTQLFLLSENCMVTDLLDYRGKGHVKKFNWDQDGRKYLIVIAYSCIANKDCSCLFTWMTLTCIEGSTTSTQKLEKLMKLVDLGEPTSFLQHVYLGFTQRECKPNESIIDEYRKSSSRGSPRQQLKRYLVGRNLTRTRSLGLVTWKVMRRNDWNDITKWSIKQLSNYFRSLSHVLRTMNSNKEALETMRELSNVCSQIVQQRHALDTHYW